MDRYGSFGEQQQHTGSDDPCERAGCKRWRANPPDVLQRQLLLFASGREEDGEHSLEG